MADVTVTVNCVMCKKPQTVTMTDRQALEVTGGARRRHIQDVLYTHTPAVRELFVSGTCGECWKRLFEPPPEEDC